MTATLSDSASFWASIAALWGAAAAWATYYDNVARTREEWHAGLRALLSGLLAEFDVVSDWASGEEGSRGYEQGPPTEAEIRNWSRPNRQIFSFECPIIHNLTDSPYVADLAPIVESVVKLSRSITRLYNYYEEYRTYVNSRPALYDAVLKKMSSPKDGMLETEVASLTLDESQYRSQVFEFNKTIHQDLIGCIDSTDSLCLYRAFRTARESLKDFRSRPKEPGFPKWYWLVHVVAVAAFVKGLFLTLGWIGVLR